MGLHSWFITTILFVIILLSGVTAQGNPFNCQNNLIYDGSFEITGAACSANGGGVEWCPVSYAGGPPDINFASSVTPPTGWVITGGDVDLVLSPTWPADTGVAAIDLDGDQSGTISQQFACINGNNYQITYAISGNEACGGATLKQGTVQVFDPSTPSNPIVSNSFSYDSSIPADVPYVHPQAIAFTAITTTGSCSIQFSSTTAGSCGPIVDSVCVTPIVCDCYSYWTCDGPAQPVYPNECSSGPVEYFEGALFPGNSIFASFGDSQYSYIVHSNDLNQAYRFVGPVGTNPQPTCVEQVAFGDCPSVTDQVRDDLQETFDCQGTFQECSALSPSPSPSSIFTYTFDQGETTPLGCTSCVDEASQCSVSETDVKLACDTTVPSAD